MLALDNLASPADGNNTLLIVNRFGGDLATGAQTISTVFGLLYNDAETGISFGFNSNSCQLSSSLNNSFPHTTPRIEQHISAGRTGWLKLWATGGAALLGAAINFNSKQSNSAFNHGYNLHKLSLSKKATLTIPLIRPSC